MHWPTDSLPLSHRSEDEVKCEELVTQSCLTFCDPMDHSPPGFSVHGILQARILEWVAMHALLQGIFQTQGSIPHLLRFLHCRWILYQWGSEETLMTPWSAALQAPLSVGFSRQVYWSGLPFPPPGGLPDPGIEAGSPALQTDSLSYELQGSSYPFRKPLHFFT